MTVCTVPRLLSSNRLVASVDRRTCGPATEIAERLPHDLAGAVSDSSRRYEAVDSLYTLAAVCNVDAATIRREQRRAGTLIRPRSGWPNSVR
jgi:hypothetical protein